MTTDQIQSSSRAGSIALWVLRVLLAVAFLGAGGSKLYGVPMMVDEFDHVGLGQWFRYFTGSLEIAGALLIVTPALSGIGALLLACVATGAIAAHLFVIGGSPLPAAVLLVLSATVAFARRRQFVSVLSSVVRTGG